MFDAHILRLLYRSYLWFVASLKWEYQKCHRSEISTTATRLLWLHVRLPLRATVHHLICNQADMHDWTKTFADEYNSCNNYTISPLVSSEHSTFGRVSSTLRRPVVSRRVANVRQGHLRLLMPAQPPINFSLFLPKSILHSQCVTVICSDIRVRNVDSGTYNRTISSSSLHESKNARLEIIQRPLPPEYIEAELLDESSTSVLVKWRPGFNGNSSILKYTAEMKTLDWDKHDNPPSLSWKIAKASMIAT